LCPFCFHWYRERFLFTFKIPRVSVSLNSGSAAGECQGLTIYT
jgi:hypothetical protein